MSHLARGLKAIALLGGVILVEMVLGALTLRHSVFYVSVLAAVVLPLACLRGYRCGLMYASYVAVALALAVSPIDLVVRSEGRAGVRVLPAHYGLACNTDYACYGCIVPVHRAKLAVVIDY